MASTNEANRSYYEIRKENKERVKKRKSPNTEKLYGYVNTHWRLSVYCKNKSTRDRKIKAIRLQYPERIFTEINPY